MTDPPETLAELVEQNLPEELKDREVCILPVIVFVINDDTYKKLIGNEVEN
jgi:hypothetical protein